MRPVRRAWTAALLGGWLAVSGPLPAQVDAPEAGTARDVIIQADKAYNEKRYHDAVAGYEGFLRDFGSSPEAAPDLPHVRYNLAAALMQAQKFDAAIDAIGEAQLLEEITPDKKENLAFWRGVALMQVGETVRTREAPGKFLDGDLGE